MTRFFWTHAGGAVAVTLLFMLAIPIASGAESNRDEVRTKLDQDPWQVIWGKNFTEADWARGTGAIAESIAVENPGPFLDWFEQTLDENFTKIERNMQDVTRADLKKWILQSLESKRIITYRGLRIQAGFATYDRWERAVYDEPRTRRTNFPPFFEAYTVRVERTINLPNWHQFYIRYQLVGTQAGGGSDSRGVFTYTKGNFTRVARRSWEERRDDGSRTKFAEVGRTDDYVELYDEERDLNVRLYGNIAKWYSKKDREWFAWPGSEGTWRSSF